MTTDGLPGAALADQLGEERARKNSFEQRGVAVITTSGTLVALVIGFLSLAPDDSGIAKPAVFVALAGFLMAAVTGLWVNRPILLPAIPAAWFRERADGPAMPQLELARIDMRYQTETLTALRKVNRSRARMLLLALALQVLALAAIAIAAFPLLLR